MPFLLFEARNGASISLHPRAVESLVAQFDRDFPDYVKSLPAIYDIDARVCHTGVQECQDYLSCFVDQGDTTTQNIEKSVENSPSIEPIVPIVEGTCVSSLDHTGSKSDEKSTVESTTLVPKKRTTAGRKRKTPINTELQ